MSFSMFLKLDDIKGESTDATHKDEIVVSSFGWSESQASSKPAGGGSGSGKVQVQSLHIMKLVDKSTPSLFLACAAGKHFKQAVISLRRSGSDQKQDFMVWKLSDVTISSYRIGGEQGETAPVDEIELVFGKIEVLYQPFNPDGSLATVVKAGWDIKLNKAV